MSIEPPGRGPGPRQRSVLALLCLMPLAQSCGSPRLDLKRLAYEMLSQEDCRYNRFEDFCQRTFANEYAQYERLRREFMREQADTRYRTTSGAGPGSVPGSGPGLASEATP